jgi:hypothetical protein
VLLLLLCMPSRRAVPDFFGATVIAFMSGI